MSHYYTIVRSEQKNDELKHFGNKNKEYKTYEKSVKDYAKSTTNLEDVKRRYNKVRKNYGKTPMGRVTLAAEKGLRIINEIL